MKLEKYRVSKFRSIEDSGWIGIDDVVALIGENESGKTNALVPLWKLNPASHDKLNELNLLKDYPRASYYEINSAGKDSDLRKHRFITAIFTLCKDDLDEIAKRLGVHVDASHLELSRDYNNEVHIRLLKNDPECSRNARCSRFLPSDPNTDVLSFALLYSNTLFAFCALLQKFVYCRKCRCRACNHAERRSKIYLRRK